MEWNRKITRIVCAIIAFAIFLMAAVWNIGAVFAAVKAALNTVSFFLIGLSAAFIMNAPMHFIETRLLSRLKWLNDGKWKGAKRPASVLITVAVVMGLLLFVIFQIIPELSKTIQILANQLPVFLSDFNQWFVQFTEQSSKSLDSMRMPQIDWVKIGDVALAWISDSAGNLIQNTMLAASSVVSWMVNLVVGFCVAVYILLQKEKLAAQCEHILNAYFPERHVNRLMEIAGVSNTIFRSFITSQFLEAMILAALCLTGMNLFGFPFAPAIATLVGVTAFIPIVGGFIGLVTGAFMILVQMGIGRALAFILFFFVLQQLENNFIYPHVVGKRVMLPGLWVLTAVTLGGNISGVFGMLISVPLCSIFFTLFKESVWRRLSNKRS